MGSRTERPAADVRQRARTGAGEKGKGPTHRSGVRPSSCPSWARTRTLLIQSPLAQADISDNLLGFGHFPSIGARFPAVVCPVLPGETTAKLRQLAGDQPTIPCAPATQP